MPATSPFKMSILWVIICSSFTSFAQDTATTRFQLGLQAGYQVVSNNDFKYGNGPSVKLTVGDRLSKEWFLNLSYEFCALGGNTMHIVAISPEYSTRNFIAGLDLAVAATNMHQYLQQPYAVTKKFTPAIGFGAHIGTRQAISKRLYITEQFGARANRIAGTIQYEVNPALHMNAPYKETFEGMLISYYLSAGVRYMIR